MAVTVRQVLERMATAIEAATLAAPYTGAPTSYLRHPQPVAAWPDGTALTDGERRYGLVRVRSLVEPMLASRPAGAYTRTEVDLHWVRVLPTAPTDSPSVVEVECLDDEAALVAAVVDTASKTGGATWSVLEAAHQIAPTPAGTSWLVLGRVRFLCQHQTY